jgi:outer membrane protein TolC
MASVGNWSKAQMMQEQLVLSDATVQLSKARQQAFGSRESLVRLLGLWGEATRFALPPRLPALPATPMPEQDIEATALRNKPEMQLSSMAAQMDLLAVRAQDMQRWTQASNMARGASISAPSVEKTGAADPFSLVTQAPLLDHRKAGLSEAVERAAHSQASAHSMAVDARSQAREAYFRYRTAYDVARYQRDEAVRLSTAMQEETQARYNGMLQSTWDLMASARARVQSINMAQQAQRDFWLSHADLQFVLAGGVTTFPADTPDTGASATTPKGH